MCVKLLNSAILDEKLGLFLSANNAGKRILREVALSVLFTQRGEFNSDTNNSSNLG